MIEHTEKTFQQFIKFRRKQGESLMKELETAIKDFIEESSCAVGFAQQVQAAVDNFHQRMMNPKDNS